MKPKALLVFMMALLVNASAVAQQYESGSIRVTNAWSRALPPVSANGAVYVSLVNDGPRTDKLTGASSPLAQRVELHAHTMEGGVMKMRASASIELSAGKRVELKPGGLHLMLIGLKQPLKEGGRFPLTLHFAHASPLAVEVVVLATDAKGPTTMPPHQAERKSNDAQDKPLNMPAAQAPTLALTLEDAPAGGFVLTLDTARFRFAKEHAVGAHVAGKGYAQLAVDGKQIARIYAPRYELRPLASGVHEIELGLYSNNGMPYTVEGKPVSQRFVVLVAKSYRRSKDSQRQRIDLAIERDNVNVKDKRVRVNQGDVVELRWTSDKNQTLHLHGYDIEAEVRPGSPVVMRFDAFAAGRFPVEIHGDSQGGAHDQAVLVYLEVYPR